MKRYKKLLVLLFSTNILFATTSPNELFSKKINETFNFSSAPIMTSTYDLSTGENHVTTQKRENYTLWLDVKTLDNVEHNNSQKILKEKMDELVGYYLKTNNLFSKEALVLAKKNNYRELLYNGFFKRLYLYLNYLEKHNNKKLLNTLLSKALNDSTMLMKNSENSLKEYEEYILSIQKIDNQIWEQIKFKSSLYKVKIFEMLGIENNDFGNIPDVMVVILVKFSVLNLNVYQEIYKEHQELEHISVAEDPKEVEKGDD